MRVPLDAVPEQLLAVEQGMDFDRLDEALQALRAIAPDRAAVVDLRYFAGLSIEDTAEVLGVSRATVGRHWTFARTWLYREMQGGGAR